jgi:toxin FitB
LIVLDTNVIAELLRPEPDPNVARWAQGADPATLHTTAICETELLAGVALMPAGRRRGELAQALAQIFALAFPNRVLPFDTFAAPHYASVIARRVEIGRPIAQADAQIAAICRLHSATLVTRDAAGFADLELDVFDPWTEPSSVYG